MGKVLKKEALNKRQLKFETIKIYITEPNKNYFITSIFINQKYFFRFDNDSNRMALAERIDIELEKFMNYLYDEIIDEDAEGLNV